jgi:hypothetical protein
VPGVETLFGEMAIRLNVTVEKESVPSSSKFKKLVVIVPRTIILKSIFHVFNIHFYSKHENKSA